MTTKKSDSTTLANDKTTKTDEPGAEKIKTNDFWDILSGLAKAVPYKMMALIYILFIVLNSTIFIEYFIEPLGSSFSTGKDVHGKGIYLQGLFLVIGYLAFYILIQNNVI